MQNFGIWCILLRAEFNNYSFPLLCLGQQQLSNYWTFFINKILLWLNNIRCLTTFAKFAHNLGYKLTYVAVNVNFVVKQWRNLKIPASHWLRRNPNLLKYAFSDFLMYFLKQQSTIDLDFKIFIIIAGH